MDLLDTEEGLTLTEILDKLEGYLSEFEEAELPDESSVRKLLKEYEQLGLVRKVKQGKQVLYFLCADAVLLDSWVDALAFFAEASPLGVVGSYLLDKEKDIPQYYRFKHHYILNALDSEILYALFLCMDEGRTGFLQLHNRSIEILPLKIYISTQTGRQYVLGQTYGRFRFVRLDLIDSVKPGNTAAVSEDLPVQLAEFQKKLWGTSMKKGDNLEHVEMVIHAEPEESFIVQRLEREKRSGCVILFSDQTN